MHKIPPQDYIGTIDKRLGGIKRYYLGARKDIKMHLPDEILQCTTFLGVAARNESGEEKFTPLGTAFAISIPSKICFEKYYNYFVTARHLIEGRENTRLCIRANTKNNRDAVLVDIQDKHWWYHPEDNPKDLYVDVAVLPWMLPEQFEIKTIPIEMLLTDEIVEGKGIGIGDEVFVTGLFTHHVGKARNIPIVRVGNIAMIPSEPVYTEPNGDIEAYLIESRSIGGLSGSPAFVIQDKYDEELLEKWQFCRPLYLLGLVKGHWDIPSEQTKNMGIIDKRSPINEGIAIVIPAKKILEIINRPELVEMRKEGDKAYKKLFAPTDDKSKLNLKFWKGKD